jgi:hypothetical protein
MFQYPRSRTTNPSPAHASVPILSPNCCYLSLTVDFCRQLFLSYALVVRNLSATVPSLSRSVPRRSFLSPAYNFFCFALSILLYIYTSNGRVNPNRFRHTLEKLAAEPPSTKTALIRSLLSEIEAALASGKTWKQVWQCLADDGLDISYETFSQGPSTGPEITVHIRAAKGERPRTPCRVRSRNIGRRGA